MTRIIFTEHDNTRHELDVDDGVTLMHAAVENSIPGILGECGGYCSCATCHAYIETPWNESVPEMTEDEQELLSGALDVKETSRLICQITVEAGLDGLVVKLPQAQI